MDISSLSSQSHLLLGRYNQKTFSPCASHLTAITIFHETILFLLLNGFITLIVVQWNNISILNPQHFPMPNLSPLETISFSKFESVSVLQRSSSFLFFRFHISESIWSWCLIVWLTSLRMLISTFIHVAKNAVIYSLNV